MRIGVTISRDYDKYDDIEDGLSEATQGISYHKVTVVHGASQMDWFIAGVAHTLGMNLEAHAAEWSEYGKRAGPIRNEEMVDLGADVWLAFIKNESRGATGCAKLADEAGIPVRRYKR